MKSFKFECELCESRYAKWQGQCALCKNWNSISEKSEPKEGDNSGLLKVKSLKELKIRSREYLLGQANFLNTFFQNGLPIGSVFIISGEPGVGKSSFVDLLIKVLGEKSLYISGEEADFQVAERMRRHQVDEDKVILSSSAELSHLKEMIEKFKPKICIIDSLQTMSLNLEKNRRSQTEIISLLSELANEFGLLFWIVAHVNKKGSLAGMKYIEHMVDGVFKLTRTSESKRVLYSSKNRFGPTDGHLSFSLEKNGLKLENERELKINYSSVPGRVFFPQFDRDQIQLSFIDALFKEEKMARQEDVLIGFNRGEFRFLSQILTKESMLDLSGYSTYLRLENKPKKDGEADLAVIGSLFSCFNNIKFNKPLILAGRIDITGVISPVGLSSIQKKLLLEHCKNSNALLVASEREMLEQTDNVVLINDLNCLKEYILKIAC